MQGTPGEPMRGPRVFRSRENMDTTTVWAETGDIHGNVCEDARLRGDDGETVLDHDTPRGQSGWEVGIRYGTNFQALAEKLKTEVVPKRGKIRRLAIHAHGLSGEVYVNGGSQPPLKPG